MDINFEYYKIFYFVAKYGNITKAAAALGSSQPNVTRVMRLLEDQLHCRLFVRGARGVSLTGEGERLYSHAEIAYRHLRNAADEIGGQASLHCGTVEIGATETAIHLCLLSALRDFKKAYPAVRIKIHNQTTPEVVKELLGGKLDFAVVTTPFEVPKNISCTEVMEFEEILVGGIQYQDLCGRPIRPEEIAKYPWVGLGRGSATYQFYRKFFITQGIDIEPDMEVATSDLMLPLIENNLGIGFVPENLALPGLKDKRLVRIPVDADLPRRSVQIILDQGRGNSLAADTFRKYLQTKKEPRPGCEDGRELWKG